MSPLVRTILRHLEHDDGAMGELRCATLTRMHSDGLVTWTGTEDRDRVSLTLKGRLLLGFKPAWMPCPCGHASCRRLYTTNMGHFYQGSGFDPEEAQFIDQAVEALALHVRGLYGEVRQ